MPIFHLSDSRPADPSARATTLHELAREFEAAEELENPDIVLPLNTLRMTEEETIDVPRLGCFGFNEWSQRQVSSLLGVRWDRWFENAAPGDRAAEVNRRLARATRSVRLRTTRSSATGDSDGTLRAFVSPGYTPVTDSRLARMLATVLAPVEPELRLVRHDVTERSVSYVVRVGHAYRKGGPGEVGDVWGGVLVRNSGVGFASLLMTLHLTRLICKNGMTAPLPDALLLKRRHRALDDDALRRILVNRAEQIPGQLARGAALLHAALDTRVADVRATVLSLLDDANLPQRYVPAILAAYEREPGATAFGVSQAVTLAAQDETPEVRLDLEHAASAYLQSHVEPPAAP